MSNIWILIDNCAWDVLYEKNVELLEEQGDNFKFAVSKLGEIEIPEEKPVGKYAREQLEKLKLEPISHFGFSGVEGASGFCDLNDPAKGGFLTDKKGRDYAENNQHKIGGASGEKKTGSGLLKNQTDIDYGEWSFGMPVVTNNAKDFKNAGFVIDIKNWKSGRFSDFIFNAINKHKKDTSEKSE